MLFRLNEYAAAETAFIDTTLNELSLARGGIVGLVGREPAARVGTTEVTLEGGQPLEFESVAIGAPMTLQWEDIANMRIEALLETLDEAAETHHNELTDYVLGHLEALTAATGNQVDATGKSFFEYMYETFETVELSFEPDGSISPGFGFVLHPDAFKEMKKKEADMTDEERRKLDELIARKRAEYFARRRSRRLS